jgi:hypothetical protein
MSRYNGSLSPLTVAVVQLGMLVLVIYYTFIGGQTALAIYDVTWRVITFYLTIGLLAVWLLWRWWGMARILCTALDWLLLSVLMAWVLSTLFPVTRVYSLETLVFFLLYIYFFFWLPTWGARPLSPHIELRHLLDCHKRIFNKGASVSVMPQPSSIFLKP